MIQVANNLAVPDGLTVRFAHSLVREALYAGLEATVRAYLRAPRRHDRGFGRR